MQKEKVLNIKVSADIHRRLKVMAALEEISIKELITRSFEEYCHRHGKKEVISK